MSYNVAIAGPIVPEDDEIAWEWVGRMALEDDPSPPDVFHVLIERLTDRHPCICDLDDDVVDDEGVWSDGPLADNIYLKAPVLGIVSRLDEVLPFLVETANELGLTVFDWQAEAIYRP